MLRQTYIRPGLHCLLGNMLLQMESVPIQLPLLLIKLEVQMVATSFDQLHFHADRRVLSHAARKTRPSVMS